MKKAIAWGFGDGRKYNSKSFTADEIIEIDCDYGYTTVIGQ